MTCRLPTPPHRLRPTSAGGPRRPSSFDAVVRSGGVERRAVARGRDIYAVTAPLAVEAVDRILTGRTRTAGVASAGAVFDAPGFLRALSPHITLDPRP
ncbi:hypothetical protein SAMN05216481_102228 [Streptomyces radiopugnans]|uniref:Uncharacterized protein n=1 Tax=Streptomyces radiopugnans TaxID=403935 RepID=A0A1H9B793_9ACTN|nr:hypothetical protein SAMN05216481_102228 [Streptomyces radiopugnans]